MRFVSFLFSLVLLSASTPLFAADYYWNVVVSRSYTSADAACKGEWPYQRTEGWEYTRYRMGVNGNTASCLGRPIGGTTDSTVFTVYRNGNSCPTGTTYNSATGACDAPSAPAGQACVGTGQALTGFGFITNSQGQCVDYVRADLPAQCTNLGGTSAHHTMYISFDGDGNPLTPPPVTAGGCEAVAVGVSHCTMAPKRVFPTGGTIQPTGNTCNVLVSFSGKTAGSGDQLPVVAGPGDDGLCYGECEDVPPAPIQTDSQPCTYVEDGEGRRVCSSNNYNYTPGNSSCGSVNGQFQCIGKAPTTNGITIDTTVKDTINSDGSKTSVKTDVATQISCTGAKACNASTTTNTTTTTYNSNGAKTGQTTSCTGAACSPTGKDKGNCEPGQECTGDDEQTFEGSELGDVGGFGESLETFMSEVRGAPIIAGVSAITVPTGGSCSFQPMDVPILGRLSLQPMCSWAADWFAPLRYLMLAIWAIVAVRTFMEA